jgi:hypothetical protein
MELIVYLALRVNSVLLVPQNAYHALVELRRTPHNLDARHVCLASLVIMMDHANLARPMRYRFYPEPVNVIPVLLVPKHLMVPCAYCVHREHFPMILGNVKLAHLAKFQPSPVQAHVISVDVATSRLLIKLPAVLVLLVSFQVMVILASSAQ